MPQPEEGRARPPQGPKKNITYGQAHIKTCSTTRSSPSPTPRAT